MFSTEDLNLIKELGIPEPAIEKQLQQLKNGFPPLNIIKNVSEGDGIHIIKDGDKEKIMKQYEEACLNKNVQKFVPASGAASRMFKSLFAFLAEESPNIEEHKDVKEFMAGLESFAFFSDLHKVVAKNDLELATLRSNGEYKTILTFVLEDVGLNYGFLPKGLIKFHSYDEYSRTAAEEHLVEAAEYAVSTDRQVYLHFTVSPQHRKLFDVHMDEVKEKYEKKFDVSYHITYSIQDPSTNTIAVDFENNPFRDDSGEVLFRPAGHGALLANLNHLDSDVVLIKNIDNVVPDRIKSETITYKKLLGGLLVSYQEKIFSFLKALEKQVEPSPEFISGIVKFLEEEVFYRLPASFQSLSTQEQRKKLIDVLNRPIRVCGMVKNTGATGGGPFWVKNDDGSESLQIVETAQMNLDDPGVQELLNSAAYFNPVDVVCGLRDYRGESFDLMEFRDENTGIITEKSQSGRNLKALELPGLWNGSMANWLTIFMEVPAITFNPVKSVNDLLTDPHQ